MHAGRQRVFLNKFIQLKCLQESREGVKSAPSPELGIFRVKNSLHAKDIARAPIPDVDF